MELPCQPLGRWHNPQRLTSLLTVDSLSRAVHSLLHQIFPGACAVCSTPLRTEPVPFFCRTCWESVAFLSGPRCPRCGKPFPSSVALRHSPRHECGTCRKRPPAFTRVWSILAYQSPIKEAIGLLKYRKKLPLAKPLARLLINHLPLLPHLDMVIPVPLHIQRLRDREFNQSAWLAQALSRHLHVPLVLGQLIRHRPTTPQTSLKKKDRLTNLRRAFSVTNPSTIKDRSILLVDDVMTTGTTLHECAKTLRRAGSGPVYGVALARMI